MTKTEYMNTLRQELEGLPAGMLESVMWAYESKFVDGMVAGRSDLEIAASLPQPNLVAAQQRAQLRFQTLKDNVRPGNLAGLLVALLGVLVFNLLMMLPAITYAALLFSAYLGSLGFYVAGIVITSISLSGVPQVNFDLPPHHGADVTVQIGPSGIVLDETIRSSDNSSASSVASAAASNSASNNASDSDALADEHTRAQVTIKNHLEYKYLWHGVALLLCGIALFMLCLLMTKYTFIGFKNYLRWNLSLLRLPAAA